jgi:hypothetical protein
VDFDDAHGREILPASTSSSNLRPVLTILTDGLATAAIPGCA